MSFQSFSKLPPPPKHRPKNLPTVQFIQLLSQLCADTPNQYDSKNHVLIINSPKVFQRNLKQKLNRSVVSFEKQLKMLGFKKHREVMSESKNEGQARQQVQISMKYRWKSNKQEYINKELQYTQKHLTQFISKVTNFRENLIDYKYKLDQKFENSLLLGLLYGPADEKVKNNIQDTIKATKNVINNAHKATSDFIKDIQINLENQVSLLRLLSFRQNDGNQQ